MDTFITVFLVILALGVIATLVLLGRRGVAKGKALLGKGTGTTKAPVAPPSLPSVTPPGTAKGPKVRVLSVNGTAPPAGVPPMPSPFVKVPGAKPPVLKVGPAGKPQKATGKPGTGGMAHVTQVINVPAFCPICGLVEHAQGCPGKHKVS